MATTHAWCPIWLERHLDRPPFMLEVRFSPSLRLVRFLIFFSVPPKITPFAFKQNAMAGIRLQVSCTLEQGDLPVKFEWFKDDVRLQSKRGGPSMLSQQLNLKIFQLDDFSSVLTVSKVKSHHSGNYTCFAMNNINTVKFTAPLTVSGKQNSSLNFPHCNVFSLHQNMHLRITMGI